MKYNDRVNIREVITLFTFLGIFGILVVIAALHQGITFLYHEIMGLLYGILFLVICLNLDTTIHRLCEKTGFTL